MFSLESTLISLLSSQWRTGRVLGPAHRRYCLFSNTTTPTPGWKEQPSYLWVISLPHNRHNTQLILSPLVVTGISYEKLNIMHRAVARLSFILILLHTFSKVPYVDQLLRRV